MHFSLLPLALLATSAAASSPASKPTFTKHHSFHAVLARGAALLARQDNYVPETTECDLGGDTCETACGPTSVECPSNNAEMTFCYDKAQEHCCPNGDGSVCETGYYCATGQAGETYCCADGMDPEVCAKAYLEGGGDEDVTITMTRTLQTTMTLPSGATLPSPTPTDDSTAEFSSNSSLSTRLSASPSPSSFSLSSTLTSSETPLRVPSVTFAGEPIPSVAEPEPTPSEGAAARIAGAGVAALAGVFGVAGLL